MFFGCTLHALGRVNLWQVDVKRRIQRKNAVGTRYLCGKYCENESYLKTVMIFVIKIRTGRNSHGYQRTLIVVIASIISSFTQSFGIYMDILATNNKNAQKLKITLKFLKIPQIMLHCIENGGNYNADDKDFRSNVKFLSFPVSQCKEFSLGKQSRGLWNILQSVLSIHLFMDWTVKNGLWSQFRSYASYSNGLLNTFKSQTFN
jgi:hypothetical protein